MKVKKMNEKIRGSIPTPVHEEIESHLSCHFEKIATDPVNHPSHYTAGNIETIDYLVDVLGVQGAIHYCHGNIIKYTGSRLHNKNNPIQDAQKAVWYTKKMIELMKDQENG